MTKDILFSMWYDSLEGTKSQGFAYRAWCAGWDAAKKPIKCECISPERCDLYDRCLKGEKAYDGPALYKAKAEREQHHEPSWQAGFAEGKQAAMNQFIRDECDRRSRPYQKPVAWNGWVLREVFFDNGDPCGHREPPSKEWVSLTDEEIENFDLPNKPTVKQFVRFVEAALRSKNNG